MVSDVGPSGAGDTVSLVVVAGGGGSGSGGESCQGSGPCEDGFNYYVYTYTNDNNC